MNNKEQKIDKLIGVISDTHGLLRPEAVASLLGVGLILHAGDVGSADVLEPEGHRARRAVRGTMTKVPGPTSCRIGKSPRSGPIYIYMIHDPKEIDISPAGGGFQVVVSGHSHQPAVKNARACFRIRAAPGQSVAACRSVSRG